MHAARWFGFRGLTQDAPSRTNRFASAQAIHLTFLLFATAGSASAQVAGSVSLSSNEMFRGETISGDDPALALSLSLDDSSGFFVGAAVSAAAGGADPRITYASQYAGYALRAGKTSIEAGIIHRSYERVIDTEYRRDFVELYAGVTHGSLKARVYVSPNYRLDNQVSYYGEINARLIAIRDWSLDGHVGLSLIPDSHIAGRGNTLQAYRDWRVQISRPLGKAFISGGIAGTNYPVYSASGNAKIFASVSYAF